MSVAPGRSRSSLLLVAALLLAVQVFSPTRLLAQRQPGSLGLGLQVGRPGGMTVKLYRPGRVAYDGLITTDGDDFITSYVHRLWERPFPNSPLHFYLGPGLMVGSERLGQSPRLRAGVSAEAGLNFYAERFEVFLHVTPTLRFFPNTRARLDGSVGLRYYLRFP